ncbi:hypothetical protein [Sinorhizobium meliloti]|nr:hypothetical protein [Sinorhizobium meliloti]
MADIGGRGIVDIRTYLPPGRHLPADEGVAQNVNAKLAIDHRSKS